MDFNGAAEQGAYSRSYDAFRHAGGSSVVESTSMIMLDGSDLACASAAEFRCSFLYFCASLADGVMKQFKHEAKGCQVFLIDGAIIVTLKCFAYDGVYFALRSR